MIFIDILSALFEGPRGPTRLAQACNVNYGRLENFTKPLESKGLIRREAKGEQEAFVITEEGYRVYEEWLKVWRRLPLGLTSGQHAFYDKKE